MGPWMATCWPEGSHTCRSKTRLPCTDEPAWSHTVDCSATRGFLALTIPPVFNEEPRWSAGFLARKSPPAQGRNSQTLIIQNRHTTRAARTRGFLARTSPPGEQSTHVDYSASAHERLPCTEEPAWSGVHTRWSFSTSAARTRDFLARKSPPGHTRLIIQQHAASLH
jgi:hypothetical protein